MKRREFLKAALAGAAVPAAVGSAGAQTGQGADCQAAGRASMPELKWRCTSSYPRSLDTIYGAAEIFAKAVAEVTDNKFQIQVFAAGEIVPGLAAADAVQRGIV